MPTRVADHLSISYKTAQPAIKTTATGGVRKRALSKIEQTLQRGEQKNRVYTTAIAGHRYAVMTVKTLTNLTNRAVADAGEAGTWLKSLTQRVAHTSRTEYLEPVDDKQQVTLYMSARMIPSQLRRTNGVIRQCKQCGRFNIGIDRCPHAIDPSFPCPIAPQGRPDVKHLGF